MTCSVEDLAILYVTTAIDTYTEDVPMNFDN